MSVSFKIVGAGLCESVLSLALWALHQASSPGLPCSSALLCPHDEWTEAEKEKQGLFTQVLPQGASAD